MPEDESDLVLEKSKTFGAGHSIAQEILIEGLNELKSFDAILDKVKRKPSLYRDLLVKDLVDGSALDTQRECNSYSGGVQYLMLIVSHLKDDPELSWALIKAVKAKHLKVDPRARRLLKDPPPKKDFIVAYPIPEIEIGAKPVEEVTPEEARAADPEPTPNLVAAPEPAPAPAPAPVAKPEPVAPPAAPDPPTVATVLPLHPTTQPSKVLYAKVLDAKVRQYEERILDDLKSGRFPNDLHLGFQTLDEMLCTINGVPYLALVTAKWNAKTGRSLSTKYFVNDVFTTQHEAIFPPNASTPIRTPKGTDQIPSLALWAVLHKLSEGDYIALILKRKIPGDDYKDLIRRELEFTKGVLVEVRTIDIVDPPTRTTSR